MFDNTEQQTFNFRTDLASERRDIYQKANNLENEIDGIESTKEEIDENIKVERVKITNENGEKAIGKPIGSYITIDIKKLKIAQEDEIQKASETLSNELKKVIDSHIDKQGEILVVGLGNIYVTPDSLGPKVINEIEVTRHIINYLPQYIEEGTRMVSAISPGVLGTTGIETVEILKGIVDNINPKLVIVIDALASRSIERISSTVQLSDTGIVPGAGVGNTRSEISEKTLGIPVVAIGIPTVVETAVLVNDSLDLFITKLQEDAKSNDYLNQLKEQDNYNEIKEALLPGDFNLIVTPKEIDDLIENMSEVVSKGINMSM
ncbi:MAG: GPR endopeptidase [Clostridia bacterium]|nr:GPR endopeptidase [Clostridia bacterium]